MMGNTEVSFDLNHDAILHVPALSGMVTKLLALSPIHSQEAFNRYCQVACELWPESMKGDTDCLLHQQLLQKIHHQEANTISTGWGGVVVTSHQHPQVEKYLVVIKGGYLALETHAEKQEQLEVKEGAGLLLWRKTAGQALRVDLLKPGALFQFNPGMEHCIIATENLLILENSTDPKGMDQDLIFIYTPESNP